MSRLKHYVRYTDEGILVPMSITATAKVLNRRDRLSGLQPIREVSKLSFTRSQLRAFVKPIRGGGYTNLIIRRTRPKGRWVEIPYNLGGVNFSEPMFISFTIDTTLGNNQNQFELPLREDGEYNFDVFIDGEKTKTIKNQVDRYIEIDNPGVREITLRGKIKGFGTYVEYPCGPKVLSVDDYSPNFGFGDVTGTDLTGVFGYLENATYINLENFDTSRAINLTGLFFNCASLTSLDVTNFDTSNVTSMNGMFSGMSSLTTLDVTNFDTGNVTSMNGMFSGMSSLTTLDVTNFDTGNVTNMNSMFREMSSLTTLDVTNFDTGNVTNMNSMFREMSSLTSLDVTNFDTSNVTNMNSMFRGMSSLTTLDVTNFDTSNVTNMNGMFEGMTSLTSLDFSGFDISNVEDMGGFAIGTAMDNIEHYSTALIYWSTLQLKEDMVGDKGADFGVMKYNTDATSAKQYIISNFNWVIIDGGLEVE